MSLQKSFGDFYNRRDTVEHYSNKEISWANKQDGPLGASKANEVRPQLHALFYLPAVIV